MNKKKTIKKYGIFIFILLICLISQESYAQPVGGSGLLDNVLATYQVSAAGWVNAIKAKATWLFWTLATISMVWTFGMLHLKNAGIGEFFGELIRFSVFTGFFKWLLDNSPQMPMDIMRSLILKRAVEFSYAGAGSQGGGSNCRPRRYFTNAKLRIRHQH